MCFAFSRSNKKALTIIFSTLSPDQFVEFKKIILLRLTGRFEGKWRIIKAEKHTKFSFNNFKPHLDL